MKIAKFGVYSYFGMESGFKEVDVFVDLDRKHPDPSKLMIWGKDIDGNLVSDFKGRFTKTARIIPLQYKDGLTASQEQVNKLEALREFLKSNKGA